MTRRLRTACNLAIAGWAIACSIAGAQTLPGEVGRDHALSELRQYHGLIDEYRRGSGDVVKEVARWDRKRLQRLLASADTTRDDMRPWGSVRFKTAVMIHTDAALDLMDRAETGTETAFLQLDVAGQLLMKAGQDVRGHVGPWHQAVAGRLRNRNWMPLAERFLAAGRDRWPQDPLVLYESGTLQELLAGDTSVPTVVNADYGSRFPSVATAPRPSSAPITAGAIDEVKRQRLSRLARAAGWLQESLDRDPANEQTRLHLGRVEMLRNQHAKALELLGQVSRSDNAAAAYLGLLFTAALHERAGRDDEARQAYGGAIARHQLNQAAYLGLSALLQRTGQGDQSRSLLRGVVDAARASRREPWWTYFHEPSAVALARLEEFRRDVRR